MDYLFVATNFFFQIYEKCKGKFFQVLFHKKIVRPWMRYQEIAIVSEVLRKLQPRKCLEWGGGISTIFFPKLLDKSAEWIAIEHNEAWMTKINSENKNPNVKIFYIPPNQIPWTGDGGYDEFKDYIEFPSRFGVFDFILIDGRARKECLLKAYELIENKGMVLLHDANRIYYHEPFGLYEYDVLFSDNNPKEDDGLWLGSKGIDIKEVLRVDKHRKMWQIYNNFKKWEK